MSSKFILQQEDGTVANGDARGTGAVDLQMVRSNADQVNGGYYSSILGGHSNLIRYSTSHAYNVIAGGLSNLIYGSGNLSVNNINGGDTNSINGTNNSYSVIGGGRGNTVSSAYSIVSGGQSNTASTNTHATVVGGQSNTASGQYSVVGGYNNVASAYASKAFGSSNTASGTYSTISGGLGNSTGQAYATVVGGNGSTASGTYSIAGGWSASASGSYSVAMGRNVYSTGVGAVALGENGGATANGAFRTGVYGGSMPYANGVLHGGTINTACGRVLVPLSFQNIQLAAGATTTKTLDLDLIYSSFAVFGLEVCTVLYQDGGAPAPLANRDPFFQKDLFCISATGSTTCAIVGSVVNVIKQGASAMLTGSITYSVTGTVLTITFTAPTGYAGTSAFSGEIDVQFTFYSG